MQEATGALARWDNKRIADFDDGAHGATASRGDAPVHRVAAVGKAVLSEHALVSEGCERLPSASSSAAAWSQAKPVLPAATGTQ